MQTTAIVMQAPGRLAVRRLELDVPGDADIVVETAWSGISAGTERLLWTGRMPDFPGMGYPLVPGYELVGRVAASGAAAEAREGDLVFVPGARCFGEVRGLFGGAASRIVVPAARALPIDETIGERGILLALAATAHHALHAPGAALPELIIGHGVLGRLLARLALRAGASPTVWERDPRRRDGAAGYPVLDPEADERRDYRGICDASGDAGLIDTLVARLAPGSEIVLAGFYSERISFAFPPAFMREARLRIAAQWNDADLRAVRDLAARDPALLDGLITHRGSAADAGAAYGIAFDDPACLKMVIDWRSHA
jgi:bacteriochlorophyllide a dehydrogenase